MSWLQVVVLSLIQGLTEFLPISSTGHLIVAERLLGLGDDEVAKLFAVGIQVGAILEGAFITETLFIWPGVGRLAVNSPVPFGKRPQLCPDGAALGGYVTRTTTLSRASITESVSPRDALMAQPAW